MLHVSHSSITCEFLNLAGAAIYIGVLQQCGHTGARNQEFAFDQHQH